MNYVNKIPYTPITILYTHYNTKKVISTAYNYVANYAYKIEDLAIDTVVSITVI